MTDVRSLAILALPCARQQRGALVDLASVPISSGTKANIVHLMDNPHFELLRHDISRESPTSLDKGLSKTIAYFKQVLQRHSRHGAGA